MVGFGFVVLDVTRSYTAEPNMNCQNIASWAISGHARRNGSLNSAFMAGQDTGTRREDKHGDAYSAGSALSCQSKSGCLIRPLPIRATACENRALTHLSLFLYILTFLSPARSM
jgi:hypothetical protein